MHHLVLRGARLLDGTGAPARRCDVAIDGPEIAALGDGLRGHLQIDCGGLVIAPGFIDTHSHSDLHLFADRHLAMKLRQGVTTEVLGQDGISVAPVRREHIDITRRFLSGLDGDPPEAPWDWTSVADYLRSVARARPSLDLTYLVPHGALRTFVMGPDDRPPSADELTGMERELEKALGEGAIGLSTGLIYAPCCYAQTPELIALGRVLKRAGDVPIVVHMRSESDAILEALDEMLTVARTSGCKLHISHFKIAGRYNVPKADAVLARIDEARAAGVRITCDQYPYAAGSTLLGAILPPWAHDGGADLTVKRLGDRATRARMREQMLETHECSWDNFWKWTGPDGIVVSQIPSGRSPDLLGKTLAEAARARGHGDALEFALDLLRDEAMGVGMVSHSQDEAVVARFMRLPYVNVCTDALLGGRPHPRAYGTYPRVLGKYVREDGVLPLAEAVRKMTSQAAAAMGMKGVGVVAPGMRANLVVFEAERVRDTATFAEPIADPVGIEHVMVGGVEKVRRGEIVAA
ncbi:MAG TPA: D-aminoacylase [Polyangiaceae bacterium]|jgi:N-acyl-D-amino-acid deacylase